MKKLYTLTISILLIINIAAAQAPQGFKYQASVRDNNGIAILNKLVAIKISLLAGTANGASVYSEVHNVVTSDFGIVNLNIGNGIVSSGNFSTIDWGSNTYFIKTEVDINNGTNFLFMGTSQLLSVPYAMFAAKSGNAANDRDQDSTNEIQAINLNGNNLQLSKNGGSVDLTKYDKDSQQLVLNGNTLSITKGNSIVLSGAVDLDADPTNEIQNLSLSKDTLKLSKANYIVLPKDNDADSTNEIQSLSVNQNRLSLSKSNQVNIDADTTNEIQSLQQNGNSIFLSKTAGSIDVAKTTNVQNGSILYATASGNNAITLTLSQAPTAYTAGMIINFKAIAGNTGAVSVNLNGLGAKQLFKNIVESLEANDLAPNQMTSIIYDGFNFQFLATPFAKKANKLANDSAGGLVPKNALIATESIVPPVGFVYSGMNVPYKSKITRVNYDSIGKNIKYLGTYNNQFIFLSTNYIYNNLCTISINKFDTLSKIWTNISSNNFTLQSNLSLTIPLDNIYLINNSIFFILNYSSSGVRLTIREYNLLSNVWTNRYEQNFCCSDPVSNSLLMEKPFYNSASNSFYMPIRSYLQNIFSDFIYNTPYRLFKFNLTNNTFTKVNNNVLTPNFGFFPILLTSINNVNYFYSNDSIYKFISNETYQFLAKIPSQNLFGMYSIASAGNFLFKGDYKYNYLSNTFTPRVNFSSNFYKSVILGNQIYTPAFYADTTEFYFREFTTESSDIDIIYSDLFSHNINSLWGYYNGIIFTVEKPKTYYYHKKL